MTVYCLSYIHVCTIWKKFSFNSCIQNGSKTSIHIEIITVCVHWQKIKQFLRTTVNHDDISVQMNNVMNQPLTKAYNITFQYVTYTNTFNQLHKYGPVKLSRIWSTCQGKDELCPYKTVYLDCWFTYKHVKSYFLNLLNLLEQVFIVVNAEPCREGAWGSGDTASHSGRLNSPHYPVDRRLGGMWRRSGRGSEKKSLCQESNPDCPSLSQSLYWLTELSRLLKNKIL